MNSRIETAAYRSTIGAVLAIGVNLALGQTAKVDPSTLTNITPDGTIFLTEIMEANPTNGCGPISNSDNCRIKIHFRVLQVLSDPGHQGLAPSQFDATVLPTAHFSHPETGARAWTRMSVLPRQRYLIFSRVRTGLPAMFEAPSAICPIKDSEDAVGDVELLLNSAGKSLRDRALVVAEALRRTQKRTFYLSDYIVRLVAFGSELETRELVQSIRSIQPGTFSYSGRGALLSGLHTHLALSREPNDAAFHVFASATARFLVEAPDSSDASEPDERDVILRDYMPWISSSSKATAAFRAELTPDLAERLLRKAAALDASRNIQPTG